MTLRHWGLVEVEVRWHRKGEPLMSFFCLALCVVWFQLQLIINFPLVTHQTCILYDFLSDIVTAGTVLLLFVLWEAAGCLLYFYHHVLHTLWSDAKASESTGCAAISVSLSCPCPSAFQLKSLPWMLHSFCTHVYFAYVTIQTVIRLYLSIRSKSYS